MQNNYFYMRVRHNQERIGGWLFVVGLFIALLGVLAIICSFTTTKITIMLLAALLLLAGVFTAFATSGIDREHQAGDDFR